jgi:hypothetical protein
MLRHPLLLLALLAISGSYAQPRDQNRQASAPPGERIDDSWAQKTLMSLSLEEKVGQLFMIRLRVEFLKGKSPAYFELRNAIRKYHVGSLVMSVPAQTRTRCKPAH